MKRNEFHLGSWFRGFMSVGLSSLLCGGKLENFFPPEKCLLVVNCPWLQAEVGQQPQSEESMHLDLQIPQHFQIEIQRKREPSYFSQIQAQGRVTPQRR